MCVVKLIQNKTNTANEIWVEFTNSIIGGFEREVGTHSFGIAQRKR
jgi:hypothetical protein